MASKSKTPEPGKSSGKTTVSGPAETAGTADVKAPAAVKLAGTQEVAAAFAFNAGKSSEFGNAGASAGQHEPVEALVSSSTVSEVNASAKTGAGKAQLGVNPLTASLDHARVDNGGRVLTTNQGVPVADNQNSLKAGLRGPALLEDFILREKITHFDHERIPERVVHARGSGAHGYFECYEPLTQLTEAALFSQTGKRTPVFVRFSTVAGERGSTDLARDVRGFAVKFYTEEGNWDLVGNNMPVFFIQDAMKFPDLIHAVKPEPHHGMPQAASAHDTFWDFISLSPESTHMMLWVMSDRAIPRSLRMMQGFGVHTFRFVNAKGHSQFVKFHWNPAAGTHSVVWDEAMKISGADPDFHRRDLWEAIEAGDYPEWELGVQVFSEQQAANFSFDVLDPTKIVPEELVPVKPVGKLVLNRNPDNFFAETEQVAFCTAHIVRGLDFTNDPLLAGRIHSYVDTQISRLGGANFHEIPINAPVAAVHNNQRDGLHRQAIARGRVAYEPNSLAGGCPHQAGPAGFTSFPEPVTEDKVRGKPEKFAEHYNQATLFWNSQSPAEQRHIIAAFRFELSKVQTPAVRERMVASLRNVAASLAEAVGRGLGLRELPDALPRAIVQPPKPEVESSFALSLLARPGKLGIRTRHVAILIADGVNSSSAMNLHRELLTEGAVPRLVGPALGAVNAGRDDALQAEIPLNAAPGAVWDAVIVPEGGEAFFTALKQSGLALELLKDQYRHCKPMLLASPAAALLEHAGIAPQPGADPEDPALILCAQDELQSGLAAFIEALRRHRNYERESDPPRV